ncbi:hypothetical protein HELRODRAFT_166119 [Helobdella robusta]|uniref:Uncharacterized protein n=1 Tax=Helobdella robusta TaxID=6412 RepID=T1EXT1_HELRO|nr:hypothetical protein HELRODRAFT_166119 [Helobdella robusta]ESN90453.1 hypothetical protein HELRODRAFT_166119 [Helobdella robusta]
MLRVQLKNCYIGALKRFMMQIVDDVCLSFPNNKLDYKLQRNNNINKRTKNRSRRIFTFETETNSTHNESENNINNNNNIINNNTNNNNIINNNNNINNNNINNININNIINNNINNNINNYNRDADVVAQQCRDTRLKPTTHLIVALPKSLKIGVVKLFVKKQHSNSLLLNNWSRLNKTSKVIYERFRFFHTLLIIIVFSIAVAILNLIESNCLNEEMESFDHPFPIYRATSPQRHNNNITPVLSSQYFCIYTMRQHQVHFYRAALNSYEVSNMQTTTVWYGVFEIKS